MLSATLCAVLATMPQAEYLRLLDADASLPHEAIPHGVGPGVDWRDKPRLGYGNQPPDGWNALVPWGQVYLPETGSPARNVRVEIRNLQGWILSQATGTWRLVRSALKVEGAAYREDFAGDANKPAETRPEPSGGLSIRLSPGFNYHFWTPGRATIAPDDVAGVVTAVEARLVLDDPKLPDDRATARLLMSVGADYWKSADAVWDRFKTNGDVAIGRFRYVNKEWGWFTMSTLRLPDLKRNPPPLPQRFTSTE
ncbi:MAG: hypothetical protein KIS66_13105 [Fimbriimonadaceae bacterium]|nr:hypothetical protein [Fimbriimonadaceae bacterium]